jgi:hypothetical protein
LSNMSGSAEWGCAGQQLAKAKIKWDRPTSQPSRLLNHHDMGCKKSLETVLFLAKEKETSTRSKFKKSHGRGYVLAAQRPAGPGRHSVRYTSRAPARTEFRKIPISKIQGISNNNAKMQLPSPQFWRWLSILVLHFQLIHVCPHHLRVNIHLLNP